MRQHPRIRKRIISVALLLVLAGSLLTASAQHSTYKIAVLASLYLDSSFDAGDNYRLGAGYPKYAIPGLEFMEGARMALDTLQTQGNSLEYHLYDTRAADQSVTQLIATHRLDSIQLLIGSVSGSDYRMLAEFAKIKRDMRQYKLNLSYSVNNNNNIYRFIFGISGLKRFKTFNLKKIISALLKSLVFCSTIICKPDVIKLNAKLIS